MNKQKHNIHTLIICIFIFCQTSSAAHFQYGVCVPKTCGLGPNISYPFYITALQQSYCGDPDFRLNCSRNFPVIKLSGNDYVVRDIMYKSRSFRVFNAALLGHQGESCVPRLRNSTTLLYQFDYVNQTELRVFYNCRNLSEELLPFWNKECNGSLALYQGDASLGNAMENCEENIVVPVDRGAWEGRIEIPRVGEVLRRGVLLSWPGWRGRSCSDCEESGGQCGFNVTSYNFRCFCPDRPHFRSCTIRDCTICTKGHHRLKRILYPTVAVMGLLLLLVIPCIIWIRKERNSGRLLFSKNLGIQKLKSSNEKSFEIFLKNNENFAPKRYRYSDIKKMTNSLRHKLGKGGYGSVYKGKLSNGHPVAVKILDEGKGNGEEFTNEVASISRTSHINIVSLLGFCYEGSNRALIYEFMPNGSLEKYISSTASSTPEGGLGCQKLFDIALGIARGLEYLHQGCKTRILHFDIKPHNILLDKDFNPRISDFGLARLCPNRSSIVSMMVPKGTIGYIAPEVFCRNFGNVSHKSDVYSYGMMVLDITIGREGNDRVDINCSSEIYFPDYIYKHLEREGNDTRVEITNEDESGFAKRKLIIVGLWCIQTDPKDRPSMSKVVEMLEGKLELLCVPPKPNLSVPPTSEPNFSTFETV